MPSQGETMMAAVQDFTNDPDRLKSESFSSLLVLWKKVCPRKKPPHIKTLLMRELAFLIQAQTHHNTDKNTENILSSASKKTRAKSSLALVDGTLLKRKFNDRLYTVEVKVTRSQQTFLFQGQVYKSLSKIAEVITGSHWSGPRFFGLTSTQSKRKKAS